MQILRLFSVFITVNLTFVLGRPWTLSERKTDDITNCVFHSLPVPLYHAYNFQYNDNVYTTSISEMERQLQVPGFGGDGIIGSVFAEYETGMVPLYGLYNQNMVDHLYTSEASERDYVQQKGYELQEIVGYILPGSMCDSMPLYRFEHEETGRHYYTLSQSDFPVAARAGYAYEGIIGYILPSYTPASA